MNTIIKILLYLVKILNTWIFVIPMKLNILATIIYFGAMYLIFGTCSMGELKYHVLEGNWTGQAVAAIFFALPAFFGFVHFMLPDFEIGGRINNSLNGAIAHRNMMMYHSDPKSAYNIMKKTAHLDMMASNSNNSAFNNAKMGFDAEVGNSSPSSVYNNLMK